MIKLALVGKNISHSRSPEIYRNFLGNEINYSLLDFNNQSDIPSAEKLLKEFDGISITSPYKKHFINEIQLVDDAIHLQAVNCLRKNKKIIEGINTDYLAVQILLKDFFRKYKKLDVLILGDGVMSSIVQSALDKLNKNYKVFSRKLNLEFSKISLVDHVANDNLLIINTCSRDFIYTGKLDKRIIFWDFNYNSPENFDYISKNCTYVDGLSMLTLQAEYALRFWSINKKI